MSGRAGLLALVTLAFECFFAAIVLPAKGRAVMRPDPTRSLSKLIFDRGLHRMSIARDLLRPRLRRRRLVTQVMIGSL
jgi:hypothetical protein